MADRVEAALAVLCNNLTSDDYLKAGPQLIVREILAAADRAALDVTDEQVMAALKAAPPHARLLFSEMRDILYAAARAALKESQP